MEGDDPTWKSPDGPESGDFDPSWLEPSTEPDAIGRIGCFHIMDRVGRGGMGVVFRAWDSDLRRIVAVKFVRKEFLGSGDTRGRFLREARAAAAVTHPNIVTVHTIGEFKGVPYLVMELVEGESLQKKIRGGRRYRPMELLQLVLQLCEALQEAHARGIVHRDIKPSNVLIDRGNGRAKVSDFGLAHLGDGEQSWNSDQGTVLGTPAYMSPEQVNGENADARSDLFSLGCLIYAVVAGHSPFEAPRFTESATRVVGFSPAPLSESMPGIPVVISKIVSRLIEKNPKDRYQSAAQVAEQVKEALRTLSAGEPLDVTETIRVRPLSRSRRRSALAVTTFLFVLSLAGAYVWRLTLTPEEIVAGNPGSLDNGKNEPGLPARIPRILTVAQSGAASATAIADALRQAGPGDTIRLLDDATYSERIVLEDSRQFAGLRLESAMGAVLVSPDESLPVIEISDVDGVRITGLRLETTGENQTAIKASECEGLRLTGLDVRQTRTRRLPAIHLVEVRTTENGEPTVIENCRIESLATGQCLWMSASGTVHHLSVQGNAFLGPRTGTLVYLEGNLRDARIVGNVFDGGYVALNLNLTGPLPADSERSLAVANNTFIACERWLGLMRTEPVEVRGTVVNNLMLDCTTMEGNPQQFTNLARHWTHGGNRWERAQAPDIPDVADWIGFHPEIPVRSRERGGTGYLVPFPDSLLAIPGTGGEHAPYVGAFPPGP